MIPNTLPKKTPHYTAFFTFALLPPSLLPYPLVTAKLLQDKQTSRKQLFLLLKHYQNEGESLPFLMHKHIIHRG